MNRFHLNSFSHRGAWPFSWKAYIVYSPFEYFMLLKINDNNSTFNTYIHGEWQECIHVAKELAPFPMMWNGECEVSYVRFFKERTTPFYNSYVYKVSV